MRGMHFYICIHRCKDIQGGCVGVYGASQMLGPFLGVSLVPSIRPWDPKAINPLLDTREQQSKLLASRLVTPVLLPYINLCITV